MKGFQLSRYLKKWLLLIIVFFVVATVGASFLLVSMQTYTASAVIEYANEEAIAGYAPDGTEIDLTEINSSANMAKVFNTLELDEDIYTLDQLCASITVEPIVEEQSVAIQEAMNEEGEEYTDKPTAYIVSCTLGRPATEELVRDILNETLDVYFEDYGNKHISQGEISNVTSHFPDSSYDYLEMVEEINLALENTVSALDSRYTKDESFRSTATGYSFSDLSDRFSLLQEVNIFRLYSQILGNQITKDKDLLLAKYRNRIASYELTGEKAQQDIEEAERIIETYVQKLRESGNTGIDYNYILDDVYGYQGTGEDGDVEIIDRTVEYDDLLNSWVGYKNTMDHSYVEVAYCEFIIGVYQDSTGSNLFSALGDMDSSSANEVEGGSEIGEESDALDTEAETGVLDGEAGTKNVALDGSETGTEEGALETELAEGENGVLDGTDLGAEETGALSEAGGALLPEQLSEISIKMVSNEDIEAAITDVVTEMNRLYQIASVTNQEFNEYLGAKGIKILSSTSVEEAFNLKLFICLIAVCFLVVGCGGAIVLGRIGDILEYLFLTDHQTGCMNRVSCDNYIRRHENQLLSNGFCCVYLQLENQRDLNRQLGREEADEVIKQIADILKELLGSRQGGFTGYNGSGQFWVFYEAVPGGETLSQALDYFVSIMEDRFSQYAVTYALGGANAGEEKVYQLRALISRAAVKKEVYTTKDSSLEDEKGQ